MARKHILIIDDEKDICNTIKMGLEVLGDYSVDIATNGKEGLKQARKIQPALILLDIMMPGIDGFEVLRRLKEDERTYAIPVIMVSARDDEETKERAARLYNELYVTKPVQIAKLKTTIDEVLRTRGG